MMTCLYLIILTLILPSDANDFFGRDMTDCYANDQYPYLKFGTKTAYEFIYERPKLRDRGIRDCEPVQIWMLARHGTRYPGAKAIRNLSQLQHLKDEIIRNHEELKNGRLCYADINSLKTWAFNVRASDANKLTKQGHSDLFFLARRTRTKYPSLLKQDYDPKMFTFRHTDSERTKQSAQSFAQGLFENTQGIWIPPAFTNDTVIKPYSNCTYWQEKVENNPANEKEAELFKMTEDMTSLVHNVSTRLGFPYDLSTDTITTIYDMCRYDKAWNVNERSPWCAAFIKNELLLLEYLEDIKSFYDSGYGDELNVKLGCTAIKDMLQGFLRLEDETVKNDQEPVGKFYFSHASELLMVLSKLGVARPGVPLRHDNYHEQKSRKWRSSELSPFAGNLEAVFYRCTSGEYNKVMFYLNEKNLEYEGCEVGLCSWSYIRSKFANVLDSCDLEWCRNGSSKPVWAVSVILFGLFFFGI